MNQNTKLLDPEAFDNLKLSENQELELKADVSGLPKSLCESIFAMANTEGGTSVLRPT